MCPLDFKRKMIKYVTFQSFKIHTYIWSWNKRTNNSENWKFFLRADSIPRSQGLPSIWHLKLHRTAVFTLQSAGPSSLHSAWQSECDCLRTTKPNIYSLGLFSQTSNGLLSTWKVTTKRKEITLGHEFTATSWRDSEKGITLQDNLMGFAAYWLGHPSPGFPRQLISKPTASWLWSRQTRWGLLMPQQLSQGNPEETRKASICPRVEYGKFSQKYKGEEFN